MLDEITRAVLSRDEIARYLEGSQGESGRAARERIHAYLDELRTTQRYPIYRALKHPLYPILRKIDRIDEHVEIAADVAVDPRSVITEQVTNGVAVRMALLYLLAGARAAARGEAGA